MFVTSHPKKFYSNLQAFGGGAPTVATAKSVHLDGASYARTTQPNPLAVVDGKKYLASFWFRQAVAGAWGMFFDNIANAGFGIQKTPGDLFYFQGQDAAGNGAASLGTTSPISDTGVWHNLIANADTIGGVGQVAVDGVLTAPSFAQNGNNVNFSVATNFTIGGRSGGSLCFTGEIAEMYIACNQNLDLSIPANVQKFRSPSGHPVGLGADGSTATGTAPTVYFSVRSGGQADDFMVNRGTGGLTWFYPQGGFTLGAVDP